MEAPHGNETEVSLDIEVALSMAPGLSKVIIYDAYPGTTLATTMTAFHDMLNRMVADNLAKQLSSSWTINTTADSISEQIFQQMAAQGQSFFQASGDSDSYWGGLIPLPADSPSITVVGGTTLTTSFGGRPYVSETVWNWGTNGSSGGSSTQHQIPSWQQGVNMYTCGGSSLFRNIPDVALVADNVYVRVDSANTVVGGTSCAAPLWAGFAALVNQQASINGGTSIGFINPAIYSIGLGSGYSFAIHDTTTGNNEHPQNPNEFVAVTGYDLCTGWGTPNGGELISLLAGLGAPTSVGASGSNSTVRVGWTPPPGATSFNVKRSPTSGGPYTTIATTTSPLYLDAGLVNGTSYYYVVSALNTLQGEGPNSSEVVGVPVVPAALAVCGGGRHTLILSNDATVWATGADDYGQLGNGIKTGYELTPVQTTNLSGVISITAGYLCSHALKSDGTVWGWGDNAGAQLGDGTLTARLVPVQAKGLSNIITMSGGDGCLALKSDGTVWSWGSGQRNPSQVTGLSGTIVGIAAGNGYNLVLKSDGSVWGWGDNSEGELGDGTFYRRLNPVQVTNLSGVVSIAAGVSTLVSMAIKDDGSLWAWGENKFFQMGNGKTNAAQSTPVQVSVVGQVTSAVSGADHSLALEANGTVWAWGVNTYGQLGNGSVINSLVPVQVENLGGALGIGAGWWHSLAINKDVWGWGYNTEGQLGDGSTGDVNVPIQMNGF